MTIERLHSDNFLTMPELLLSEYPTVRADVEWHVDKVMDFLADLHGQDTGAAVAPVPFAAMGEPMLLRLRPVFDASSYMEGDDLKLERRFPGSVAELLDEYGIAVADVFRGADC